VIGQQLPCYPLPQLELYRLNIRNESQFLELRGAVARCWRFTPDQRVSRLPIVLDQNIETGEDTLRQWEHLSAFDYDVPKIFAALHI
jgi:hypothetical protein